MRTVLLFVATIFVAAPAHAQAVSPAAPGDTVHWAYSALFGTGVYRLDDRTVSVLRIPISFRIRDPHEGKPGVRLHTPISLGTHRIDIEEILGISEDDISTIAFVPGIQLDFPIGSRWNLTTAAYFGVGRDFSNDTWSEIVGAVVSASYTFDRNSYRYELGSNVTVAGYRNEGQDTKLMTRLGFGFSTQIPTRWRWGDRSLFINPQLIVYYYSNEVEFITLLQGQDFIDVGSEVQIGLALGADRPFSIFGFQFDRVGLGYRYSDDLKGVKLVGRFPF